MRRAIVAMGLAALAAGCGGGAAPPLDPGVVTGTRIDTWWQDDGTILLRPDLPAGTAISALVPEVGGYRELAATIAADGHFTIPGVGPGPYFLKVQDVGLPPRLYRLDAHSVELGITRIGRPDARVAQLDTTLGFEVTGLQSWATGGTGCALYSTGASFGILSPASTPPVAATQGTFTFQLQGQRLPAAGDLGWLVERAEQTTPGGARYVVAVRQAGMRALENLADGAAVTLGPIPLAPAPASGAAAISVRASEYDAVLPAVSGMTFTRRPVGVGVRASPRHPLANPFITLLSTFVVSQDTDYGTLTYPRFLPDWFTEFRDVQAGFDVTMPAALGAPALTMSFLPARVERVADAAAVVKPELGPPRSPTVAGRDALLDQGGVGETPRLAWSPPALGTPNRYSVTLYDRTAASPVQALSALTPETSLVVPPGLLQPGHVYFAAIHAFVEPGFDWAAPRRATVPLSGWPTVTAAFTP
jgi:hypothetical protein